MNPAFQSPVALGRAQTLGGRLATSTDRPLRMIPRNPYELLTGGYPALTDGCEDG